jgi:signal transduction histidine kinase
MLNLVQNAIDATQPGGAVEISTEADAQSVSIFVRDSGTGIREDDLDKVFEPFYTTKVTGVGLGLAIVKRIVSDHNGEISVKNLPHGGTEFRIVLNIPGA